VILIESKGGTGNSGDQIARYDAVSVNQILGAGLDFRKPQVKSVDVILTCEPRHVERQIATLDALKSRMVVVSYDADEGTMQLRRGRLTNDVLNRGLTTGISVPWPPTPSDYIPFDCNSSDIEIAEVILPTVIAFATKRRKTFDSNDVCRNATPYWSILHPGQKKALARRVDSIVQSLVTLDFHGQFAFSRKSKRNHLVIEVTPMAMTAARKEASNYARRMLKWQDEVLVELTRLKEAEAKSGPRSLFPEVIVPLDKPRKVRKK
jgi:hypothetical protein